MDDYRRLISGVITQQETRLGNLRSKKLKSPVGSEVKGPRKSLKCGIQGDMQRAVGGMSSGTDSIVGCSCRCWSQGSLDVPGKECILSILIPYEEVSYLQEGID